MRMRSLYYTDNKPWMYHIWPHTSVTCQTESGQTCHTQFVHVLILVNLFTRAMQRNTKWNPMKICLNYILSRSATHVGHKLMHSIHVRHQQNMYVKHCSAIFFSVIVTCSHALSDNHVSHMLTSCTIRRLAAVNILPIWLYKWQDFAEFFFYTLVVDFAPCL